ncbi:hypothetical protein LEMLEM_LOCUS5990, partial [Lemmus lemmus]
ASPSRTCSSAQSASECSRQSWRKRAWVWLTRLSNDSSATVCSHSFQPLNQPASTPTWSRNIMVRGPPSVYEASRRPCPPQSLAEPQPRGLPRRVPVPRSPVPGRCSFRMVISGVPGSTPRWAAARTLHTRIPKRQSLLKRQKELQ